jgi:TRAP-type uncharacterized transport system substrate-binding protein
MRPVPILFVASIALLLTACDAATTELTIVRPTEVVDRGIVEELEQVLEGNSPYSVSLTEDTLSESEALDAVAAGTADFALVSNHLLFRDDIATVMPLYPTVLHIGTNGAVDNALEMDLPAGTSVFAGPEGSTSRLVFSRIASRLGLMPGEFTYADDSDSRFDLVVVFAPISRETIAAIEDLREAYTEFQLASMGTPDEIGSGKLVDAAVLLSPNFRPFIIPKGTYGEATATPVVTLAIDKMLVTRPDLDPALVYDLIGEIVRLQPALAENRPSLFQRLSGDFDTSRSIWVVHSGTQDYLHRDEPSVYERYSGIAEVVVTLFVALASASIAGVRLYRMRRKNRIDTFYARAMEIRRQAAATADAAERNRLAEEMRALQETAFAKLMDEKLAADESFRIFITLSNDVLDEISRGAKGQN